MNKLNLDRTDKSEDKKNLRLERSREKEIEKEKKEEKKEENNIKSFTIKIPKNENFILIDKIISLLNFFLIERNLDLFSKIILQSYMITVI